MNDIKIPYKLFVELYKCHCMDDFPVSDKIYIHDALQAKFEALKRHADYSERLGSKGEQNGPCN